MPEFSFYDPFNNDTGQSVVAVFLVHIVWMLIKGIRRIINDRHRFLEPLNP